jgi:hypothetical protein
MSLPDLLQKRGGFWLFGACGLALAAAPGAALAMPTAPGIVCETYPELPDCQGQLPDCANCHVSIDPPRWNAYGESLRAMRSETEPFETWLPEALRAVESLDADGDGVKNLEELEQSTSPGDEQSVSSDEMTGPLENPRYDLARYDAPFAFRRMSILYCGRSPSYAEMQAFTKAPADAATLKTRLHAALGKCLSGAAWTREILPRLADKRIRPLYAAGPDSDVLISGSLRLVIGDYNYDYRLWRYVLTGDRDARELLTAQYHVDEQADGTLVKVEGTIAPNLPNALTSGQPLAVEHRAGLITTQWFLSINTMFSALPRTSAAHAYRSYLGADISMSEGLRPVAGEPLDIDEKGVAQERCAVCHSTLDPLSYAFAEYDGLGDNPQLYGTFRPERPAEMIPGWSPEAQQSVLLGQEVSSVVEWARVAVESDEFKRNLADIFFWHALGRSATGKEQEEFAALWQALPADGYSANKLIHRLVDTDAFGRP